MKKLNKENENLLPEIISRKHISRFILIKLLKILYYTYHGGHTRCQILWIEAHLLQSGSSSMNTYIKYTEVMVKFMHL